MRDENTPDRPAKSEDDDLLKRIREFTDMAISAESENRTMAVSDLQFLKGDQWPAQIAAQRESEGRPVLKFNRLTTFLHQVTNDQRQNKVGIKVHPVGFGADSKTAEIYQGMIRHIENDSSADTAYDTAVNSAAAIGFGFWRLITEYESPMSFDQVIKFQRLRDSLKVYFDPASVEADGSDCKQCAIVSDVPKSEFERQYPEQKDRHTAGVHALGSQLQPGWINSECVRVVEYYYFHYEKKTLYLLEDGSTTVVKPMVEDIIRDTRDTQVPQLKWVKATAGVVLDKTDIKCQWIPVFPVYGIEIDIQGKITRKGIIRDAKDPQQMYNYWMTCATEEVSLRPKSPYIMAEGQDEGYEKMWAQANNRSFSTLKYKPIDINGTLAPPPQRQPMADVPVGMLQMAVHASDNIKAVTGLFDSSLGARGTATSGIQEREQQRQGDTANFHYTDNLHRSIKHCGRCLVDMIPSYYDADRVVQIMRENGDVEPVEINKPVVDPESEVQKVLNDMTVGRYGVTFDAGPSYATAREEIKENMIDLGKAWPQLLEVAGDKFIEAMDWPGSDKIARRIKATIDPKITAADEETEDGQPAGPPPLPPEIEQALANADQMVDQLQQQLAQEQAGHEAMIEKERIAAASREEVARIGATSRTDVEELKGMVALLLQKMQPPPGLEAAAAETGTKPRPAASQAAEPAQPGPTDAMSGS